MPLGAPVGGEAELPGVIRRAGVFRARSRRTKKVSDLD
jgi:hypothetical protein